MRHLKAVNVLLWVANALLGAAIVVFAFAYLLFPAQVNHLDKVIEDVPGSGTRRVSQAPADFSVLRNLGNPVTPRTAVAGAASGPNELERVAKFLGGYRIADRDASECAFLLVPASNQNVNAYRGEPITSQGQLVADLRGWTLLRLTEEGALFTNGSREVELRQDSAPASSATSGAKPHGAGSPFDMAQSKSRKTASSDAHESWTIDGAEINWANGNVEALLADVQLSAYPSGGVKIDAAGAIASQRGFVDQDVIKTVNGAAVRDRADLVNMANSPQFKNAGAVVIVVERAGRPYTLDFRPDFQRGPR